MSTNRNLIRTIARLATAIAITATAVGAIAGTAHACSDCPRNVYETMISTPAVQVNGTYTPLVGNFSGSGADDIFWYAPGAAIDYLWTSDGVRGSFTKQAKPVNGTYTPIVGNFSGDSFDDILWYAAGPAADSMWTSISGPAIFQASPMTINGTYQPLPLDNSLRIPTARAADRTRSHLTRQGVTPPRDSIIWYRPGVSSDLVWRFGLDGTVTTTAVGIVGSPQLIPLNIDDDPFEDFVAYSPGAGPDASFRNDGTSLVKTARTVNGSYRPYVVGGGSRDGILWHGPGPAVDAYWRNDAFGGLMSQPTDPVGGTGPIVGTSDDAGSGYIYDANGPDKGFLDGNVNTSLNPDIGPGAQPVTGFFDNDIGLDAFFYRPGPASDTVAYSFPVIAGA